MFLFYTVKDAYTATVAIDYSYLLTAFDKLALTVHLLSGHCFILINLHTNFSFSYLTTNVDFVKLGAVSHDQSEIVHASVRIKVSS